MAFISPMGVGFFMFFQRNSRENVKEEVKEFELSISRSKEPVLGVIRNKNYTFGITRLKES